MPAAPNERLDNDGGIAASPRRRDCERRGLDRRHLSYGIVPNGTVPDDVDLTADCHHLPHRTASVLVVDDHGLLADTTVHALRREGFLATAVRPASPAAVLEDAVRHHCTVALVDLDLGTTEFDGLDVVEPLVERGVQVVTLTSWQDPLLMAASFDAGARGVVSKADPFAAVLDAVTLAARRQLVPDPVQRDELCRALRERRRAHQAQLAPFHQLTPRESEVLELLLDGSSAESIAAASYVSMATVRSQIRAVLTKLGVNSQLGAVAVATRYGWSGPETPMVRYSSTLAL